MLTLDRKAINLASMRVEMTLELKDQDMSGQSSSTGTSEQGDKGKKLSVTGRIAFTDVESLTQIYTLASAKDEDTNERKVYRIGNDTAKALKIRNVKFTGNITAREDESLQAWNVSFVLREYNSIAEQKEQRAKEKTKPEQRDNTRQKQALKNAEEAIK